MFDIFGEKLEKSKSKVEKFQNFPATTKISAVENQRIFEVMSKMGGHGGTQTVIQE